MVPDFSKLRSIAIVLSLAAVAACSSHVQNGGTDALPALTQNARTVTPNATPPVTAPVTIPYAYVNTPTNPSSSVDSGTTTVKFILDSKTGVYDVPEIIKSKLGYSEVLNSAVAFPAKYKRGTAQIILSDNFTYVAGSTTQTGMDTYPQGQNSIDFPLTTGRKWSAAANHLSYTNLAVGGKSPLAQNNSVNEAADGTYSSQTSFSSTKGGANQDNYAAATAVSLSAPSTYSISMRAAGFNTLTQSFALPSAGSIAVTNSGKAPVPAKLGTVMVKDWYPGGSALPKALYSDDWKVTGTVTTPTTCKARGGQSATQVVETFANLDPVQGFYDTYTATYYLMPLGAGQYWFACIIENYTNNTYANGWVMNKGHSGKLIKTTGGTETLIAKSVSAKALRDNLRGLSIVPFPAILFRAGLAIHHGIGAL